MIINMIPNDNQVVVDLSKVRYASTYYVNQDGCKRERLPKYHSIHGLRIESEALAMKHPSWPGETCLQRAKRLGILDEWTQVTEYELSAHRKLRFVGEKAKQMWELWRSKVFGGKD